MRRSEDRRGDVPLITRRFVRPLLIGGVSALLFGLASSMLLRIWRGPMAFFLGPWWIIRRLGAEPALVNAAMTLIPDRPLATFFLVTGVSWFVWSATIAALLMFARRRRGVTTGNFTGTRA